MSLPDPDFLAKEDVENALGIAEGALPDTDRLKLAMLVAEQWVRIYLGDPYLGIPTSAGSRLYTFHEVGTTLDLPYVGEVLSVSVQDYYGAANRTLVPEEDWYVENGLIRFRAGAGVWPGLPADEQALGDHFHEVTVELATPDPLSPIVKQGTAMAAGAVYTRLPSQTRGIQSESLGDYSYTLSQAEQEKDPQFAEAKSLLRWVRNKPSPVVV